MKSLNVLYAQSGGVTAVINATAAAVIEAGRKSNKINKVLAAKNGILGALKEELIDTNLEGKKEISKLKYTPGGVFGSCRYKLQDPEKDQSEYQRLMDVFTAHNIQQIKLQPTQIKGDFQSSASEYLRQLIMTFHLLIIVLGLVR